MFLRNLSNISQFLLFKHLSDRVMRRVKPDHLSFGSDGLLEFLQVDLPLCGGDVRVGSGGRSANGDVNRDATALRSEGV